MKFTTPSLILLSATATSAARRDHDGHGTNETMPHVPRPISLPSERPTATWHQPANITAYSSAVSSLCGNTFPPAAAAIESCLSAYCIGMNSRTGDLSYPTSMCATYSSCSSATASNTTCTRGHGFRSGFGIGGHDGPGRPEGYGRHGDGNGIENGHCEGKLGQHRGPDGYYRVGPSVTCTDGMVTTTAIVMDTVTDAHGSVQTHTVLEVGTEAVVKMEQVDGETETSAVGAPMSTASAAAAQLGVRTLATMAGLALGVVAVL